MTAGSLPIGVVTGPGLGFSGLTERLEAEQAVRDMEAARADLLPWWRTLSRYFAPRSAKLDGDASLRGNALNAHLIHEEGVFARDTLRAAFHWGITNPSRPWRQVALPDLELAEDAGAQDHLHVVNDRMETVLSRSNFYAVQGMAYNDVIVYGTGAYLVEEDERDILRCVPWAIGTYTLADDERGEVGAASRRFWMTLRQLVRRFGTDPITGTVSMAPFSVAVQNAYREQSWQARFEVVHLLDPNPDVDESRDAPDAWPIRSIYWEASSPPLDVSRAFMAVEGYREWPLVVFRWWRAPDDPYGIDCPGMECLGSNKSLQVMESKGLKLLAKIIDPPLTGPTLPQRKRPNLLPGEYTPSDYQNNSVRAIHEARADALREIREDKAAIVDRIQRAFFTRYVLALISQDGGQRTAREVEEISQEKFLVFGSTLESFNGGFGVFTDRQFAIMVRRGLFPPAPESLQGRALTVVYTSAMAQALKSLGLGGIERFAQRVAELYKMTGDPRVLMKLDGAQVVDEMHVRSGTPPRIVRSDAVVEQMERAQAEAAQRQQRAEQGALEAKAARDLAAAPIGRDSALDAVIAGGTRGPGQTRDPVGAGLR